MKTIENLNQDKCTGCGACMQACPINCINMIENKEGFLTPIINTEKCISCGKCIKSCPQLYLVHLNQPLECYGAKHRNEETLINSSSGGMFTLFADAIIKKSGCVYGCGFINDPQGFLYAKHLSADNLCDAAIMRGSKYVQSDTGNTYQETKDRLENDQWVLYTGTPCEIAGLKGYLKKDYERLITVDLICHGVPSPRLFKKFIEYCELKNDGKIIKYEFRNKSKGTGMYYYYYYYRDNRSGQIKSKQGARDRSEYFSAFARGDTYREACYTCIYAQSNRVGDISIGDYFALDFQHPEFDCKKGVSAVLINTEKGKAFFEEIKSNIDFIEVQLNEIKQYSANLQKPSIRTENRSIAYDNIEREPYEIFTSPPFTIKKIDILKALMKEHMPDAVRRKLRSAAFKKG